MDVKQILARILYPYGSVRSVRRGPGEGLRFVVAPGIGFTYAWGVRDAVSPRLMARVREGMTVYDVGSNKGQMAMLFAKRVGARGEVLAFEPVPEEFTSLERNVRLNGLDHVRLHRVAASDARGTAVFTYADDRPTQGKLRDVEQSYVNQGAHEFEVETVTLDGLWAEGAPPPDLMKIDVEGAGASVLRGARRLLDEVGPAVYIETHGPEEQAGVRDELVGRGYVAETMDGDRVDDVLSAAEPLWCHKG